MSEYSENDEIMNEDEEVLDAEVSEDEELDEDVVEDEMDEDDEDDEEETEEAPADKNEILFDKAQRAARLLRGRKDALRDEEDARNERVNNTVRAVKLLELKPQMDQKEISELLGIRLRELDSMMAEAEKNGIVTRVLPEEEDMRAILVSAEEGAAEAAAAQGRKTIGYVPELTDEELDEIFAALDKIIDPLQKMGLDNDDRGPRGGFGGPRGGFGGRDDRRGGDRGGRGGFGGRDDRGGRGGFGGRGGDRGGRGGFDRGGRDDRRGGDRGGRGGFGGGRDDRRGGFDRGGRDDRRGGFGGNRGGFDRNDRGGRGGFGGRDDRGGRGGFGGRGGRDDRGSSRGGYGKRF